MGRIFSKRRISVLAVAGTIAAIAATELLGMNTAFASGFEKGINWGAKEAGYVGIGSVSNGASALYFNPAGLVNDKAGSQIYIDLSPSWASVSGPVDVNNDSVSAYNLTVIPSIIYDYTLNEHWAIGLGYYVASGVKSEFYNTPLTGNTYGNAGGTGTAVGDLSDVETSLGVSYKLNDQWKFGAGWRISNMTANFGALTYTSVNTLDLMVVNLRQTDYSGYRLGVQYKPADKTTIGLEYRSEVKVNMQGSTTGFVTSPLVGSGTVAIPIDQSNATLRSVVPMQADLGVEQEYEHWRALAQVDWAQYSRVGQINIDGPITYNGGTLLQGGVAAKENWSDQWIVRLAGEYTGWSWPLRFGYSWTSQVTDPSYAGPTVFPPAMLHSLALGSGQTWTVWDHPLEFNVAADYSMSSGSANGSPAGTPADTNGNPARAGTISLWILAVHTSLAYSF